MSNDQPRSVCNRHVGAFPNFGGGIVVKFIFADDHTELLVLHAELVFELIEHINRSILERSYQREEAPLAFREGQPAIVEEDYDTVDRTHQIETWTWRLENADFKFAKRLQGIILTRMVGEIARDRPKAVECGFEYRFGVGDALLSARLQAALLGGGDTADADRVFVNGCN